MWVDGVMKVLVSGVFCGGLCCVFVFLLVFGS